jgi:hypothetical protein
MSLEASLENICVQYRSSFKLHVSPKHNEDSDLLADMFNISQADKRENRQYWGRELGMCWQRIITEVFRTLTPKDFKPPRKFGADEPFDLQYKSYAVDTKYRIGSGDAGTLKKFKQYGELLIAEGMKPVQLILRQDNLPAAIQAIKVGGWDARIEQDCFDWIETHTSGFKIDDWMKQNKGKFSI